MPHFGAVFPLLRPVILRSLSPSTSTTSAAHHHDPDLGPPFLHKERDAERRVERDELNRHAAGECLLQKSICCHRPGRQQDPDLSIQEGEASLHGRM